MFEEEPIPVRIVWKDRQGRRRAIRLLTPDGPQLAELNAEHSRLREEFAATEMGRRLRNGEPVVQHGVKPCPDSDFDLFTKLKGLQFEQALRHVVAHEVDGQDDGQTPEQVQEMIRAWKRFRPQREAMVRACFEEEDWQDG
ncbi:MAG: hypothetical protein KDA21_15770, partial [Phycisphaerales bacterium]|nr:hypothetical protein [Phycisphaerales bacterium]